MEAYYTLLNASAPDSLVWNWLVTPDTSKWQGTITNAKIKAWMDPKMPWPRAADANGDTIHVSRTATASTISYKISTVGMAFPITIDPTVNDTALGTASAQLVAACAAWTNSRDSINASTVTADNWNALHPGVNNGNSGVYSTIRSALTFPMQSLPAPGTVDSALIYISTDGTRPLNDSTIIYIAKGTFTSPTPAAGWFKQFVGWTSGSAHTFTPLDSTHIAFLIADGATVKSTYFNRGGLDTLKNHMGVDSLRLMLIEKKDYLRTTASWENENHGLVQGAAPYLKIYYNMISPTVTTVNDSLGRALVGNVSNVGSVNPTVRGIKYWKRGGELAADTITITDTSAAGYPAGLFTIGTKTLISDTTYYYKFVAVNVGGLTYSAIDSFTATAGGTIMVDGREVGGIH
jgi:hypothetical protein